MTTHSSNRLRALSFCAIAGFASLTGCVADVADPTKAPLAETFASNVEAGKEDTLYARMTIVGSLEYGDTSRTVRYSKTPRYRAFKFEGNPGDEVDIWVRGPRGDAVAFLLDNEKQILAQNDDADATTLNAHITATLTANADTDVHTYYIALRDYYYESRHFTVTLEGHSADLLSCESDADCVKVQKGCCPHQGWTAVNTSSTEAYRSTLGCSSPTACIAIAVRADSTVAECNRATKQCELVAPEDISCAGFTRFPHACPDGYECQLRPGGPTDVPGQCVKTCAGKVGFSCEALQMCVDDTGDDCDPSTGGADCGGLCKQATQCERGGYVYEDGASFPAGDGCNVCSCSAGEVACTLRPCARPVDCRTEDCEVGSSCTLCGSRYACVADGAGC